MPLPLLLFANIFIWLALVAALFGRLTKTQANGLIALGCIPAVAAAALGGATTVASVFAAMGAVNAWLWWNGGGGDGTRRRLRRWARRFQGVRRTAPQGA
jgi:membrane protein implicated in regulation of membrane protease activity